VLVVVLMQVEFQQAAAESWAVAMVQEEVPMAQEEELMGLVAFLVEAHMQVEGFQAAVLEWAPRASLVVTAAVVDHLAPCMQMHMGMRGLA
jgi:hypothetical protein